MYCIEFLKVRRRVIFMSFASIAREMTKLKLKIFRIKRTEMNAKSVKRAKNGGIVLDC